MDDDKLEAQYSKEGFENEYMTNSTRLTFDEESDDKVQARRMSVHCVMT